MRVNFYFFIFYLYGLALFGQEKISVEQALKDLSSDDYETRIKAKKLIDTFGIRAIPLLRKAIHSEDLETREYAEKKVLECVSYDNEEFQTNKMLGVDGKIVSTHKYLEEYYEYLKGFILKSYEKNAVKDSRWDAAIKKMIPLWVGYHKQSDLDFEFADVYHSGKGFRKNEMELRKCINEISALGCNDPFFLFLRSSLYYAWSDYRFSLDELVKLTDDLVKANYSYYFKYYSSVRVKAIKRTNSNVLNKPLSLEVFKNWMELGKEEFIKTPVGQRRYLLWLSTFFNELPISEIETNINKISENVGKGSWLDHMIQAKYFMKLGLESRKKEEKSTDNKPITNDFVSCMKNVQEHCNAAAQLNPDFPEPYLQMISLTIERPGNFKLRYWLEKAFSAEANNATAFTEYIYAMWNRYHSSIDEMLSFGREYLMIEHPKVNFAKFYISALQQAKTDRGGFAYTENLIDEIEWAVEQQFGYKSVFNFLFYNDLAFAAFEAKNYKKTLKAIENSKGLFATGWGSEKVASDFVVQLSTLVEKYQNTKTALALKSLHLNDNGSENIKIILENLSSEIDLVDQPKIVNLLAHFKLEDIADLDLRLFDLLYEYGYREKALILFFKFSVVNNDIKLKEKLMNKYGARTIEALLILANHTDPTIISRLDITNNIKEIFLKDNPDALALESNDAYQKAQIRACLYVAKFKFDSPRYRDLLNPYVNKIQNIGDCADFLTAQMLDAGNNNSVTNVLSDYLKSLFYNPTGHNFEENDQETNWLSSVEDKTKLWEDIQKIWINKGKPAIIFEMIKILRARNLNVEAERLRGWLLYSMDSYYSVVKDESLVQILGVYPGYHKEAFQMGIFAARSNTNPCNVVNYLIAYHAFKLGHFHFAYEYLTKAQLMKDHGSLVVLNRQKFAKSDELLEYIVKEMVDAKEIPEYIRFNLKDQFDVKFKK